MTENALPPLTDAELAACVRLAVAEQFLGPIAMHPAAFADLMRRLGLDVARTTLHANGGRR